MKAASATYPLQLDIAGGTLELDGGVIQDVLNGIQLDSGSMVVKNSAMIYGRANAPATEATLYVNGGALDWEASKVVSAKEIIFHILSVLEVLSSNYSVESRSTIKCLK